MTVAGLTPIFADDSYVEPGSLRLSHEIVIENVMHRLDSGWRATNNNLDKTYTKDGSGNPPWKSEWGESLLTEAATRITPDIFGRVLFEMQGDYADRFWRPNNIEHDIDNKDRYVFLRQAEARVDKDEWFVHGFQGVGHNDWYDKGDFFHLYPASYPDDDYLGRSGAFGIYPDPFKQDNFLNISKRHAPRGVEGGVNAFGMDFGAALGNELNFGYNEAAYGRVSAPIGSTRLTFVYKNEDVPYMKAVDPDNNERDRAYALSWRAPFEAGHVFEAGVKYRPFRVGQNYLMANDVSAGSGLQGSSTEITEGKTGTKDAFAERIRYEHHASLKDRVVVLSADVTHAGLVAGNKNEIDLSAATDIVPVFRGILDYTYRKPLEGPIPLLYEGTPANMGAIAANPRSPESPFTVDWDNREAVFLTATFIFDPTPGTSMLKYNPSSLQMWNVNSEENAPFNVAFQYKMSDYRTATDRLTYIDAEGNYVFEPAGHEGAWATDHPISAYSLMLLGHPHRWSWMLGISGGQMLAYQSLAYTTDTSVNKPITDFYSIEAKLERWPYTLWAHYGYGVWGPENYQAQFGEAFDRLWGLGLSYKITVNTTVDVSYLAARQDDNLFVAPDLGSYDEIRTLFSHRFGFQFQFVEAARSGYQAR